MADRLETVATTGGLRVPIRVIPRSPRDRVEGIRAGRLLVRVTAPPVDAAANEAVVGVLADRLGLPRRSIQIVAGGTSRNKTIEVAGFSQAQFCAALGLDF